MVCPKCEEIFKKEFPLNLEGQVTEFKRPVCNSASEADLPYKPVEERELVEEDFTYVNRRMLKILMKATDDSMIITYHLSRNYYEFGFNILIDHTSGLVLSIQQSKQTSASI